MNPALDHSGAIRIHSSGGASSSSRRNGAKKKYGDLATDASTESGKASSNATSSLSFRLSNLHKYLEGELVAAGWPAWLSAVAGEAIQGWVPLKSDSFEKLEKVMGKTFNPCFHHRRFWLLIQERFV